MPINNRILDNGIRLVTEPIATTEAVAIGFWFPLGSRDELSGESGITHFVEHMLFKGTPDLTAYDIARFFDRIGGYVNAFTEREMLCVHCLVPALYAFDSIDILVRMIYESCFYDSDIEKERSVITSEILASLDDPEEIGLDFALAAMYPDHPFSRPVAGSVDDVLSLSGNSIRGYRSAFFHDVRPLVSVAGNVDAELIAERLDRIHITGDTLVRDSFLAPDWHAGASFPVSKFAQSQIFLSYPLAGIGTSTVWHAFSMINAIIGDTVSSRLYQSLREEKGLCYSVGSFFLCSRDSSFWMACAAVPPEKTFEAVSSLFLEIDRVRISGFSTREFEDAKEHLCGEMIISAEDIENRMKRLARQWFYNKEIHTITESVDLVKKIESDMIVSIIRNSLCEANQSLLVYGPKKQTKGIRKLWK